MFTANLNITSILSGCEKNQRKSQKQLYFLLREFAFRICHRYTAINDDPTISMHEAYIKLFKSIEKGHVDSGSNDLLHLKKLFKNILVDTCIENNESIDPIVITDDVYYACKVEKGVETFFPKTIIDAIRMLLSPFRIVFNLSVIDGYSQENISSKLQISITEADNNLKCAKKELEQLIQHETKQVRIDSMAS